MNDQPRTLQEFARRECARARAVWKAGEYPADCKNFSKPSMGVKADWLRGEVLQRMQTTTMTGAEIAQALGVGRGQIYRAAKELGYERRRDGTWGPK